tara:strand:- start:721 stop:1047 length:327 start_codon:yes stop_codon:yes gene_type:complete
MHNLKNDNSISEEDKIRSDMYCFLAGVLQREPSDDLVRGYNDLKGDKSDMAKHLVFYQIYLKRLVPMISGMNIKTYSLVSEGVSYYRLDHFTSLVFYMISHSLLLEEI